MDQLSKTLLNDIDLPEQTEEGLSLLPDSMTEDLEEAASMDIDWPAGPTPSKPLTSIQLPDDPELPTASIPAPSSMSLPHYDRPEGMFEDLPELSTPTASDPVRGNTWQIPETLESDFPSFHPENYSGPALPLTGFQGLTEIPDLLQKIVSGLGQSQRPSHHDYEPQELTRLMFDDEGPESYESSNYTAAAPSV